MHSALLTSGFPCDNGGPRTTTSIMLLEDTVTDVFEVTASYCSSPGMKA